MMAHMDKRSPRLPTLVAAALASAALLLTPPRLEAQPPKGVDADVHALLDITGSFKIAEQLIDGMAQQLGKANPKIPESFWAEMRKKIKKEDFYALITPIYRRHLSPEDIKGLLAFYRTPLGQRVVKSLPAIAQESMVVGQAWGEKIGRQIVQEARQRGYGI
jgi:hypothetical protein